MDGRQLSSEGFVYKKKYFQSAISDRNYSKLPITKPFVVEGGGQLPSTINKKMENKVNKFCSKVAKCLNLESGPIKFDYKILFTPFCTNRWSLPYPLSAFSPI